MQRLTALGRAREESETVHEEYGVEQVSALRVDATNGDVTIRGEDCEAVSLRGHKRAVSGAQLDDLTVDSAVEGDELVLSVALDRGSLGRFLGSAPRMDLELVVPASLSTVHVAASNGDVDVESFRGDVVVASTNGNVQTRDIRGTVAAEVGNGEIDLDLAAVRGDVTGDNTNGDVRVRVPPSTDATVSLHTTNGDATVHGFEGVSGPSATLGDGTHRIDLETSNGTVELRRRD